MPIDANLAQVATENLGNIAGELLAIRVEAVHEPRLVLSPGFEAAQRRRGRTGTPDRKFG
ncbi:hypothetical protein [Sphingosinicella sp. BN140058]|uniref:hypothetical protein n=1 Tax=Sphingosinicella sp. BN140058 TaxID=1892855 RepID=UPI0010129339|nr:hypothetical protein [Sphingosinicella sp. BN140058]QAY78027.1 hypothetical protein ETR14_16975 [Sphingosinicella sp. BN140058]